MHRWLKMYKDTSVGVYWVRSNTHFSVGNFPNVSVWILWNWQIQEDLH